MLNKSMQQLLKKEIDFSEGIHTLLQLRRQLMEQVLRFRTELSGDDLCAMPYLNARGYHNKTIAYSLWHIFRIEDIVANTLIADREQIFFSQDYERKMNTPIITTGNELVKEEIAAFSRQLDIDELYQYITDVDRTTTELLQALSFADLKKRVGSEKKKDLESLQVVSEDENARWLIDYWCSKDVRGLIQMPFSRHWIMHIEACLRIEQKLVTIHSQCSF